MKLATHVFEATGLRVGAMDGASHVSRARVEPERFGATDERIAGSPERRLPSAVRLVGILAFCQSLIFLVIWLIVCAAAGAATKPTPEFTPDLKLSSYDPVHGRDPFAKPGFGEQNVKAGTVSPTLFRLQGILYQPDNPSAIVNDKLVTLNKIVTFNVGNAEVRAKVVEITRTGVSLEVGGQRIELQLSAQGPQQTPAGQ